MSGSLGALDQEDRTGLPVRQWVAVGSLVLLALSIVAIAMWFGGGTDVDTLPAAVDTDDEDAPFEEETPDADDDANELDALPMVTYEVYLARDPFEPVRTPPVETVADDDTIVIDDDTIETGDPDATVDPDDPGAGDPGSGDAGDPGGSTGPGGDSGPATPSPTARCEGGEDEVVCNGQVLTLLDIVTQDGADVAVVQVDTTVYEVRQGERFADHYQVTRIDRNAGVVDFVFFVGDQTQSATLDGDPSALK